VLTVFCVAWFFECKALHAHLLSVYYDTLVERLSRKNVLHSPDKLELVFIQLFNVANRCRAVGGFLVVLLKKSTDNLSKLAVLVNMLQVHS